MAKGIKKVKYINGKIIPSKSVLGARLTVEPDEWIYFGVEYEAGATVDEQHQPVTWFRESMDTIDILHSETSSYPFKYGVRLTKMMCGSYSYFIDASLNGVASRNPALGVYVKGYCKPKIVTSKWSIQVDGKDVRKTHQFSYGDIINLSLETEGLNCDIVHVELYRRVQRGGGLNDDIHTITFNNAFVTDGEINISFRETYTWKIAKPENIEYFYVRVRTATGVYVTDGKSVAHATYLRIKNAVSTKKVDTPVNNTAVKIGKTDRTAERISFAAVYFRPLDTWNGEFGFDWLREDDNGLKHTGTGDPDPVYANIIEGGYLDGSHDLTGGATGTAYAQLKNQYERLPMANTGYAVTEYFVPYLTLFPKSFVDTLPATVAIKPKYEADLHVFLSIKDVIDRLEFEYDKNSLIVSSNTLSDKNKTNSLVFSADTSIKVTCKIDLHVDKEIKIYCYRTNGQPRSLAGKIIVVKNDSSVRKKLDFVLVGIDMNINGIIQGRFGTKEENNLYHSLHQALIVPNIEKTILDLSSKPDFQLGGKNIETLPSRKNLIAYINNTNHNLGNPALYTDTQNSFFNDKDAAGNYKNMHYRSYFTLFKFGLESNYSGTLGAVEHIGIQNVIMFTLVRGDDCTLNHEALHGLGLNHTHRDEQPIITNGYKYVFPCAIANRLQAVANNSDSTDNVMSYRSVTRSTWRWQWHIINPKISEK